MTPLQLSILIHYHSLLGDFRDLDAPAVADAMNRFCDDGMIEYYIFNSTKFRITEKGNFFVDYLCTIPLPVSIWKIPECEE